MAAPAQRNGSSDAAAPPARRTPRPDRSPRYRPFARLPRSHSSKPDATSPVRRSAPCAAAPRGRWRTRSWGGPCGRAPRSTARRAARAAATSACQSSRFSIGPAFRFQPRAIHPGTHSRMPFDQVLRVGDDQHAEPLALPAEELEHGVAPAQRHPVVGGGGRVEVEVAPLDAARWVRASIRPPRAARVVALAAVAEAALVEVERRRPGSPDHLEAVDLVEPEGQLLAGHRQPADRAPRGGPSVVTRRATTMYSVPAAR